MSASAGSGLSKHRLEALSDGIFAVAMTLLVIELKLPEGAHLRHDAELLRALAGMTGKFIAWIVSFAVLALYWHSHQRLFHHVKKVDGRLVALSLFFLATASLLPFASALSGQFVKEPIAQAAYSAVLLLMGAAALLCSRHVHLHPELCGEEPLPEAMYRATRLRTLGLMVVALVAVGLGWLAPGTGNFAFLLMIWVGARSRKIEAAAAA